LAKLTKRGELQNRIDRKNEEIDLLKVGLSGIVKRYGFQTVHDFYKIFAVSITANDNYQDKADRQEDSIYKRLQNYQRENADRQTKHTSKSKDKRAR